MTHMIFLDFCFSESKEFIIERAYVGSFMTALQMGGTSLTLMHADPEQLQFLGECF